MRNISNNKPKEIRLRGYAARLYEDCAWYKDRIAILESYIQAIGRWEVYLFYEAKHDNPLFEEDEDESEDE